MDLGIIGSIKDVRSKWVFVVCFAIQGPTVIFGESTAPLLEKYCGFVKSAMIDDVVNPFFFDWACVWA